MFEYGKPCGEPAFLPCGALGMGEGCQASPWKILILLACLSPPVGCLFDLRYLEVVFFSLPLSLTEHFLPLKQWSSYLTIGRRVLTHIDYVAVKCCSHEQKSFSRETQQNKLEFL